MLLQLGLGRSLRADAVTREEIEERLSDLSSGETLFVPGEDPLEIHQRVRDVSARELLLNLRGQGMVRLPRVQVQPEMGQWDDRLDWRVRGPALSGELSLERPQVIVDPGCCQPFPNLER